MIKSEMYSKELIKGTLKPIILQLLSTTDRMYGYEITQKVKEISEGKIKITEGALYPTLHRLEADGLLQTETIYIGKRVRKYYKLTEKGVDFSKEIISKFDDFLITMRTILNLNPGLQT